MNFFQLQQYFILPISFEANKKVAEFLNLTFYLSCSHTGRQTVVTLKFIHKQNNTSIPIIKSLRKGINNHLSTGNRTGSLPGYGSDAQGCYSSVYFSIRTILFLQMLPESHLGPLKPCDKLGYGKQLRSF